MSILSGFARHDGAAHCCPYQPATPRHLNDPCGPSIQNSGIKVQFYNPSEHVRELLKVTHLDRDIQIQTGELP